MSYDGWKLDTPPEYSQMGVSEEDLPADWELCRVCGYEHMYEPISAERAHLQIIEREVDEKMRAIALDDQLERR